MKAVRTWTAVATWVLAVNCASRTPAPSSQAPSASPSAGKLANPCVASSARAQTLLDSGRLWSARRLADTCPQDTASLRAKIDDELGAARKADNRRPAPSDHLVSAEQALSTGKCSDALSAAEASYRAFTPNPLAAVVAGQASACLKREAPARTWFARVAYELELDDSHARGWSLLAPMDHVRWLDSNALAVQRSVTGQVLRDSFGTGNWLWTTNKPPESTRSVRVSGRDVDWDAGALRAREPKTGRVVWTRAMRPDSRWARAFTPDSVLVLNRKPGTLSFVWENVDAQSGRTVRSGTLAVPAVHDLLSEPFASWFAIETLDTADTSGKTVMVVVDGRGKVVPDAGCRPLAVWSRSEFISDCQDPLALFAVDVESGARRKLGDKPPGDFTRATTVREGFASLSGRSGVLIVREEAGGPTVKPVRELTGMDCSRGVSWSPDHTRLAAIGAEPGRSALAIWNSKSGALEGRWLSLRERFRGHGIGVALSSDRSQLALGGCPELQSLDLASGTLLVAAAQSCEPVLAPELGGGFAIATKGATQIWRPPSAPRAGEKLKDGESGSAGPSGSGWLAITDMAESTRLLHSSSGRSVSLPSSKVLAISANGAYVAYAVRREGRPRNPHDLVLGALRADPPTVTELWKTSDPSNLRVLFSRSSSELLFKQPTATGVEAWHQIDVRTLKVVASPRGSELDGAVELSADAAMVLRPKNLLVERGKSIPLEHADYDGVLDAKQNGLGFAAGDRLLVAGKYAFALLWRTRDGAYLGRVQPLADGGALFTPGAPTPVGKTGVLETALIELLGTTAPSSLRCVVGERLYDWQICGDRYEAEGLVRRALESAR